MRNFVFLLILPLLSVSLSAGIPEKNERQPEQTVIPGFTDTPVLPGGKWHVHDPNRPQPEVAAPQYDGQPVPAPANATVLFDGTSLDNFTNIKWKLENGVMIAARGSQKSKEKFGDIHLHVEWLIPADQAGGTMENQGNSGVFLMDRYEIQIINCWANRTYPDGMTGAVYGQTPPLVNACRKPGEWQCYDIHFKAPVFKDGQLVSPAIITVYFNNVLIQDKTGILGTIAWKKLPVYTPHEPTAPFSLQYHGYAVHFRNIWVAPLQEDMVTRK